MTNKKAIRVLEHIEHYLKTHTNESCEEEHTALDLAIKAIERDSKVDDITFHWNDEKSNFVAACNAFEDILKVYDRGGRQ